LIGNLLIIFIYAIKKRRTNSSHVYLLCLAVNDNLFLIIHLIEDTLKTFIDAYSIEKDHFLRMINIVDMNNIQCRLINYLRNILRFVSVYIVVAFTLQRLLIVFKPLTTKFKSNKSAWKTVLVIIIISVLFNIWVPFIFKINNGEKIFGDYQICDVGKNYSAEYFYLNLINIILVLIIPMILILVFNGLIFSTLKKSESEGENLQENNDLKITKSKSAKIPRSPGFQNLSLLFDTTNNKHIQKKEKSSRKTSIKLSFLSFSYLILYLPYLICWLIFYYKVAFDPNDFTWEIKLFSWLQIAEIFYIFYYGFKFYLLYLTSAKFRSFFTITGNFNYIFLHHYYTILLYNCFKI